MSRPDQLYNSSDQYGWNAAASLGGALHATTLGKISIYKASFVSNNAATGAAVGMEGRSSGNFELVEFSDNNDDNDDVEVSAAGGALSTLGESKANLTECAFLQNQAYIGGAGHHVGKSIVGYTRCAFIENEASAQGGGFLATGDASVTIRDTAFLRNVARLGGGAVYNAAGGLSYIGVDSSYFAKNKCEGLDGAECDGGAASSMNEHYKFVGCSFYANTATGSGGALFLPFPHAGDPSVPTTAERDDTTAADCNSLSFCKHCQYDQGAQDPAAPPTALRARGLLPHGDRSYFIGI